jgi:hypothetical protein
LILCGLKVKPSFDGVTATPFRHPNSPDE